MADLRVCDNCGRWVEKNEIRYIMQVTLMAEPGPAIELPDPADIGDVRAELEKLVESMEGMSDEQIEEAVDQVHESYQYTLCAECRLDVHRRMKRRENIVGPD
jgi:hypothetical protein